MTHYSRGRRHPRGRRAGFSLPELLVGLVITAVVGAALTTFMMSQARFFDRQNLQRGARFVSRAALNVVLSDLRMVEASSGVVAASPTSVTLRVPYAFGLHCSTAGGASTISSLPVDPLMFTEAGFSGYAWRNAAGQFTYVTNGVGLDAGTAANCTAASITTLAGGRVLKLTPALPAASAVGSPVLLFRQIHYEFKPSAMVPGRIGLWRRLDTAGVDEELVAPFDATARFRFYVLNSNTAQSAVPAQLSDIRGLELNLNGASERAPRGGTHLETAQLTTAVFFVNRLN